MAQRARCPTPFATHAGYRSGARPLVSCHPRDRGSPTTTAALAEMRSLSASCSRPHLLRRGRVSFPSAETGAAVPDRSASRTRSLVQMPRRRSGRPRCTKSAAVTEIRDPAFCRKAWDNRKVAIRGSRRRDLVGRGLAISSGTSQVIPRLRLTRMPVLPTLNGRPEVIVKDTISYQKLLQRVLELEELTRYRKVAHSRK